MRDSPRWHWYDNLVEPYIAESALWPVLFALLAHVSVGLAVVFIAAYRGDVSAGIAAVLAAVVTALPIRMELVRHHRPRGVAVALGLTWLGGIVAAVAAVHYDFY